MNGFSRHLPCAHGARAAHEVVPTLAVGGCVELQRVGGRTAEALVASDT